MSHDSGTALPRSQAVGRPSAQAVLQYQVSATLMEARLSEARQRAHEPDAGRWSIFFTGVTLESHRWPGNGAETNGKRPMAARREPKGERRFEGKRPMGRAQ